MFIPWNEKKRIEQVVRAFFGWQTWTDWTPTVTQDVAVAATVTEAKYTVIGKVCHIYARLAITGAGTGNNPILISGYPTAVTPAWKDQDASVGTCMIVDNGTGLYPGMVTTDGTGANFVLRDANTGAPLGQAPNFALANNDSIGFSATYRVA